MDELEKAFYPYWKEAKKDALTVLAKCLGLVPFVAGGLWIWSDLSLLGSHVVACVMLGGVVALAVWVLVDMPAPGEAIAPDALLQQIATLTFVGSAGNDLREVLRQRGCVTIGEVSAVFQNERIARRTQESLEQPGAKALLGN